MKTLVFKFTFLFIVSLSFAAHSESTASVEDTMDIQVLKSVADIKFAGYSKANEAGAKVFQMVYGDGGYNSSTAFVIIEGAGGSKGFQVAKNISGITRTTFSGVGELTLNFTRTKVSGDEKPTEENHSVKIKFSKQTDGSLADTVQILD